MATLTNRAKEKLTNLADAEEDALALINATLRRIAELTRMLHDSQGTDDAANIEHELARLNGKRAELQQRHRSLAQLNARLQQWLDHLPPGAEIIDSKMPTAELRKGEDYPAAVRRVRSEIATLSSELADVNAAALPVSEIKERMKRHVAERAGRGRPNVTVSQEGFEVSFTADAWSKKVDPLDLLCFLDQDRMVNRLCQMIDDLPVPPLVLTSAQRSARLAAIRAKTSDLELHEEASISAAEKQGQFIARRSDADPQAVLCIETARRGNAR